MRRPNYAALLLTLVCCLPAAGCGGSGWAGRSAPVGPDADGVLAEVNSFTAELMRKIETAPDPAAGLAEAQRLLDGRREALAAKISAIKRNQSPRADDAGRARLLESEVENVRGVSTLRTKFMSEAMRDDGFRARLDRFVTDYESLWRE